jgi:hypothetical protein
LLSQPGPAPYAAIARDVALRLNERQPRRERIKLPRVADAALIEEAIVRLLWGELVRNHSPEQIVTILTESGLGREHAEALLRRYGASGLAAIGLPTMVRWLGKKTVTDIVERAMVAYLRRVLGREAAEQLLKRALMRLPQRTVARGVGLLGPAWLAVDLTLLASSPARRMTLRAVPFIACMRTCHRLAGPQQTPAVASKAGSQSSNGSCPAALPSQA